VKIGKRPVPQGWEHLVANDEQEHAVENQEEVSDTLVESVIEDFRNQFPPLSESKKPSAPTKKVRKTTNRNKKTRKSN
jgi:hypothetical protein